MKCDDETDSQIGNLELFRRAYSIKKMKVCNKYFMGLVEQQI